MFFPSTKPSDGFPFHPEGKKISYFRGLWLPVPTPFPAAAPSLTGRSPLAFQLILNSRTHVHLRAFASAGPCLQFSRSRPWHGSHVRCTVDMYIDTATCTLHKLLLHVTSGRSLSWLPCSDCSLQSPFSVFEQTLSTTPQGTCSVSHVSLPTKNRDLDGPNVCHIE